ncbi:MAG: hypothetical protein IPJ65_14145 [Archangiaceae bacterium]|nr:hypothetical protein [Archangiaceae bacterium]
MRRLIVYTMLCAAGCARRGPAAEPDDCTASTPLVAGVPGSPGHLIASELHPEGASGLATLMRAMEADLKAARAALARGEAVPALYARHRRIRCAWPTSPADREGAFDALAVGYLERVKGFDAAPEKSEAYATVLGGCRACHEQSCPGPLAAIDALAR